jgi:hypothetical protein
MKKVGIVLSIAVIGIMMVFGGCAKNTKKLSAIDRGRLIIDELFELIPTAFELQAKVQAGDEKAIAETDKIKARVAELEEAGKALDAELSDAEKEELEAYGKNKEKELKERMEKIIEK